MDNDDNDNNIRSHTFHIQLSPHTTHNYRHRQRESWFLLKKFLFTRRSYFTRQQILITHPIFLYFYSVFLSTTNSVQNRKHKEFVHIFCTMNTHFYSFVFLVHGCISFPAFMDHNPTS